MFSPSSWPSYSWGAAEGPGLPQPMRTTDHLSLLLSGVTSAASCPVLPIPSVCKAWGAVSHQHVPSAGFPQGVQEAPSFWLWWLCNHIICFSASPGEGCSFEAVLQEFSNAEQDPDGMAQVSEGMSSLHSSI